MVWRMPKAENSWQLMSLKLRGRVGSESVAIAAARKYVLVGAAALSFSDRDLIARGLPLGIYRRARRQRPSGTHGGEIPARCGGFALRSSVFGLRSSVFTPTHFAVRQAEEASAALGGSNCDLEPSMAFFHTVYAQIEDLTEGYARTASLYRH